MVTISLYIEYMYDLVDNRPVTNQMLLPVLSGACLEVCSFSGDVGEYIRRSEARLARTSKRSEADIQPVLPQTGCNRAQQRRQMHTESDARHGI